MSTKYWFLFVGVLLAGCRLSRPGVHFDAAPPAVQSEIPKQSPYAHQGRGLLQVVQEDHLPASTGTRDIHPSWVKSGSCWPGEWCSQGYGRAFSRATAWHGDPQAGFLMAMGQGSVLVGDARSLREVRVGGDDWSQLDEVAAMGQKVLWMATSWGDVARCQEDGCNVLRKSEDQPRMELGFLVGTAGQTAWVVGRELDSQWEPLTDRGAYRLDGGVLKKEDFSGVGFPRFDVVQMGRGPSGKPWALIAGLFLDGTQTGTWSLAHFDGTAWSFDSVALPMADRLYEARYAEGEMNGRWIVGQTEDSYRSQGKSSALVFYRWDQADSKWKRDNANLSKLRYVRLDSIGGVARLIVQNSTNGHELWTAAVGGDLKLSKKSSVFDKRPTLVSVFSSADTMYVLAGDASLWRWGMSQWELQWDPDALDDEGRSSALLPDKVVRSFSNGKAWLAFCNGSIDNACTLLYGKVGERAWQQYSTPQIVSMWGARDDDMWFATKRSGLLHFDGKQFERYGVDEGILSTKEGYDRFQRDYCGWLDEVSVVRGTSADDVWALAPQFGGQSCLLHFDGSSWAVIKETAGLQDIWPLPKQQLWGVEKDRFVTFDAGIWTGRNLRMSQDVSKLVVDDKGVAWIMTGQAGVPGRILKAQGDPIWGTWSVTLPPPERLRGQQEAKLVTDGAGGVWAFQLDGQVSKWDDALQRWSVVLPSVEGDASQFLPFDAAVSQHADGSTWLFRRGQFWTWNPK